MNRQFAALKPVRIENAHEDREAVRELFRRHSPYRAAAMYLPDGSDESVADRPRDSVLPWFRETWALGGRALVDGAGPILHNPRFLAAAQRLFDTDRIVPKTVVVNVNAPMPAGVPHVDVPTFRGASRENYPLRLLIAMGASGLFERWRIIEAGAISWFYEGAGGAFDYWPEGPDEPMLSEQPPFGNVAILTDSDRMFHRIGRVGDAQAPLPRMTGAARIAFEADDHWRIHEGGEVRASYPASAVRLSVLWKAEVEPASDDSAARDELQIDEVSAVFRHDLRQRGLECGLPANLLTDSGWCERIYAIYARQPVPVAS